MNRGAAISRLTEPENQGINNGKMERQKISQSLVLAVLLGAFSLHAGEKIQFSSPVQRDRIPGDERAPEKASPNLFDKYRGGGADALQMPYQAPLPAQGNEKANDNRKDWILAKPGESVSEPEARNGSKRQESNSSKANGLDRYVQQLEKNQELEQAQQRLTARERNEANEQQSLDQQRRNGQSSYGSGNPNASFDSGKLDRESFTFKDFWRETTGVDSRRFDEQTAARRTEFQQIFETRSTLDLAATENKIGAERLAPAPTDFNRRTSQSSQPNQEGYSSINGSRSALFDKVNDRALGRDSSSAFTRVEPPKAKAQPAVLPFPSRPGELFKRPGSL